MSDRSAAGAPRRDGNLPSAETGLGALRRSDLWNLPEEPSPLRHPARLLATIGAATVVVGVVLPWIDYGVDSFHATANGLTNDTWGVIAVVIAAGLVTLLASRSVGRSRARSIQLLPAFLGLAGLVILIDALLGAGQLADSYRLSGYVVSYDVGIWILPLGSILCAAGGLASSIVAWRGAGSTARPVRMS